MGEESLFFEVEALEECHGRLWATAWVWSSSVMDMVFTGFRLVGRRGQDPVASQLPWKPCGTRTGSPTVATVSRVAASSRTRSLCPVVAS